MMVETVNMLIDGEWVPAADGERTEVENPAKRTVIASIPRAKEEDVNRAVAAAKRAFVGWSSESAAVRGALLLRIADIIAERSETIARILSSENGNALRTQARGELGAAVQAFRYFGGLTRELKGETTYLQSSTLDYTRLVPYGVVGSIIPWNSPIAIAGFKIAPAIATGNTVVLKVPEDAPLAVLELSKIFQEILPPGVVNIITGSGSVSGVALANHPDVQKLSFTGSSDVGSSIMRAAADRVAAVTLELGGKSAQIVFPDVDLAACVSGVLSGMRITRQGQSCSAGSRIFVHDRIIDDFLAEAARQMETLRIGDPLDEATDIGAIVNQSQLQQIDGFVQRAADSHPSSLVYGGGVATKGELANGYFYTPTVFLDLPDTHELVRKEVFGPVLAVSRWSDEGEVLRRANESEFGLAGFVWGNDLSATLRAAHGLEAGFVMINQGGGQSFGHSYGGMKRSGLGRELSLEGMLESYTQRQQISVAL